VFLLILGILACIGRSWCVGLGLDRIDRGWRTWSRLRGRSSGRLFEKKVAVKAKPLPRRVPVTAVRAIHRTPWIPKCRIMTI
jgi:hypothetical protein